MTWVEFLKNSIKGNNDNLGTLTMTAFSNIPTCGQETAKKLFKKYFCFSDFYFHFS